MDIGTVVSITVSLFLILDPFASVSLFINVTKDLDRSTMKAYANRASFVAAALLIVFVLIGQYLMDIFGVSMDSFRVAGGIIFLMMAIELVFGLRLSNVDDEKGAKWAIIASPVLTGPVVITTAILLSSKFGIETVMISSVSALLITWAILRNSDLVVKYVGKQALGVITRVIGLFIAAMGIESIFSGTMNWFATHDAAGMICSVVSMIM